MRNMRAPTDLTLSANAPPTRVPRPFFSPPSASFILARLCRDRAVEDEDEEDLGGRREGARCRRPAASVAAIEGVGDDDALRKL